MALPLHRHSSNLASRECIYTKTALILHEDLTCIFVLSSALLELCFAAIPAHTVPEADLLIAELNARVDLLLMSDEVPGAQAFARHLESAHPELITIRLTAECHKEIAIPKGRALAVLQTPDTDYSVMCWIETLRKALKERTSQ